MKALRIIALKCGSYEFALLGTPDRNFANSKNCRTFALAFRKK